MISVKSLVFNIWRWGGGRGGKDGAWDSFEDLMRAVTFPRKKHNFTNKLHKVHRPESKVKNCYFK